MKPGMTLITRRCLCVCMSSTWGGQQAIIRIIPVLIYEALKHLNLNNCFMSWTNVFTTARVVLGQMQHITNITCILVMIKF